MADLETWLPKLCPRRHTVAWSVWAFEPFYCEEESGRGWTVATNDGMLVAVAGRLAGFVPLPPDVRAGILPLLSTVYSWKETLPLTLLRRWCGQAEYRRPCDCERACWRCQGEGIIEPESRPGRILGRAFDRRYLACGLEELGAETVQFAWGTRPVSPGPAVLEPYPPRDGQNAWRVLLMPLDLRPSRRLHYDDAELLGAAAVNPAWLTWNRGTVRRLARAIRDQGRFADLPILADALEEAGCADAALLDHARGGGPHVDRCWLLDALLDDR